MVTNIKKNEEIENRKQLNLTVVEGFADTKLTIINLAWWISLAKIPFFFWKKTSILEIVQSKSRTKTRVATISSIFALHLWTGLYMACYVVQTKHYNRGADTFQWKINVGEDGHCIYLSASNVDLWITMWRRGLFITPNYWSSGKRERL